MVAEIHRRLPVFSSFIKTLFDDTSASGVLTTLGVSSFMQTVLDDTTATAALTTLGITNGTYTPTSGGGVNIDAVTMYLAQYVRVGSVVNVSGKFDADPTAGASTVTSFTLLLPIASALATDQQCGGVAQSSSNTDSARISGDVASDRALIQWRASSTSNAGWSFIFTYLVV